MGRFEGFYTGETPSDAPVGFADSDMFARRREKKERERAKADQLHQWETELHKCSSRKLLKAYINKYKSVDENPYVKRATEKLDNLDFQDWKRNENGLKQYIAQHPNGRHVEEAKNLILRLKMDANKKESLRAERIEKVESIFAIVAIAAFVIVFCLVFFGTDADFWEAGGAALSVGLPIAAIYNFIVKPLL